MGEKKASVLVMQATDNVGIAIRQLRHGENVSLERPSVLIEVKEDIPFGFKIAIEDIKAHGTIRKYGEPIGNATTPIRQGQMVHVHNMEGRRGRGDL